MILLIALIMSSLSTMIFTLLKLYLGQSNQFLASDLLNFRLGGVNSAFAHFDLDIKDM
jgi:hypothetical protein